MTDISVTSDGATTVRPTTRRDQRLQRLSTILALVTIGLAIAIVRIATAGDPRFSLAVDLTTVAYLATVILFPIVGSLIAQRRPSTRVAWLMIAMGLTLGVGLLLYGYGTIGQPPRTPLPGALAALVLSQLLFVPAIAIGSTFLFLLFPSDRLLGPRWRLVALLSVAGGAAFVAASMLRPGELDPALHPGLRNPIGLPPAWSALTDALLMLGNVTVVSAAAFGAWSLVLRYRGGDPIEQAQIRWVALVGVCCAAAFAIAALQVDVISDAAWALGFAFLASAPIAIGFAITRYRLYDIDRLINRTLVYGSLTAILAGVFTAGIGLAQRVFVATTGESSDAAIVLTTLVVATTYAPLRKRLEALVDRWFKYEHRRFGAYRDEVTRVLSVIEPKSAAARLVTEAVRELEAAGGAVVDAAGTGTATAGEWPAPAVIRMAIPGGHGSLHTLLLGPRRDGRPHDPLAVAQLEETATLVASAVRPAPPVDAEARR
jgi:hypothetical protein